MCIKEGGIGMGMGTGKTIDFVREMGKKYSEKTTMGKLAFVIQSFIKVISRRNFVMVLCKIARMKETGVYRYS